ncbi:MAG: (deoxy)nucleoside triphosphate pyrophosphohydrolase [Marinicellaceae bacterium]
MSRQTHINSEVLNVVALVLENHQGEILIAKRAEHKHLGGMWEFPGGKVESGETQLQALIREIKEEIDYDVVDPKPLIITTHKYTSFTLTLDVWYEKSVEPKVHANENQPIMWVNKDQLKNLELPDADAPIIEAIFSLENNQSMT